MSRKLLHLVEISNKRRGIMQISPIPTLSDEINDVRLRTADIVANRIIPNEGTIYAGGDKSKKLRKEINEEVKKQGLWAPHLPEEYGGMGNGFLVHAYMNEILAWSPLGNRYGDNSPTAVIELVDRDVNAKGLDSGPVIEKKQTEEENQ